MITSQVFKHRLNHVTARNVKPHSMLQTIFLQYAGKIRRKTSNVVVQDPRNSLSKHLLLAFGDGGSSCFEAGGDGKASCAVAAHRVCCFTPWRSIGPEQESL